MIVTGLFIFPFESTYFFHRESHELEDMGLDGKIILKRIFKS
jgi:hypothetical protein